MKKIIIMISILIITFVTIIVIIMNQNKNNVKKEETIQVINENYQVKDNTIYYEGTIINNSKIAKQIKSIDIIFKDKKAQEIVTVTNEVNKKLKPKETAFISSQTKVDLQGKQIKEITYKIN